MTELLKQIATILEVDELKETDELKAFAQWDSLAVLSVVAMLDAKYGINLPAAELGPIRTVADLWTLVQSKRDLRAVSQTAGV